MASDRPVASTMIFRPGQIVLADWRGDALPKEPNKRRPAVVVEDDLFPAEWPNVILVPLTDDEGLVIPDLSVRLDPSPENGCSKVCWAVCALVTTTSKLRIMPTDSSVRPEQLEMMRKQIAFLIGADI
ncbi:type II toxin-antitoxin system PemK/MazF family toxin [Acetobacter syzygii]|uniref:Growth inhibitor PemK n=1 Tax=Acetobacter syzygii TaxID=146476 RepID=A0A270B6E4_9PROT|nr:type II toxin-antitoxin system PemK/MazF family toxin [Acetobacter syzygii]NSL92975.1 type II toxin-antitoxin system PemK/MazF family toxin [Acetobacter syzygii]PAL20605.1 hypothetical protein B9K05_12715 [Acetobacter syzygii]PAL22002.1 hypothetical protein B9K04_12675 [Acetobacter syzygii]